MNIQGQFTRQLLFHGISCAKVFGELFMPMNNRADKWDAILPFQLANILENKNDIQGGGESSAV